MKSIYETLRNSLIEEAKLISIGTYKAWVKYNKIPGIHFPDCILDESIVLNFDRAKNPFFNDNSIIVELILSPEKKDYCIDGGKIAFLSVSEVFGNKKTLAEYHGGNSEKWMPEPKPIVKDLVDEIIKYYNF